MKRLIFFFLIVGLAGTGIVYVQKRRQAVACDFCERAVCQGTFYRIHLSWGQSKKACCARCGIRYGKERPGRVKEVSVMDFAAGKWVPAWEAFYVEGSDFTHCSPAQILRGPRGGCLVKCFDRCLPSVVAFQRKGNAQAFIRDHGGQVLTFDRLKEKDLIIVETTTLNFRNLLSLL